MISIARNIIDPLSNKPKNIFLLDSIGALLTTVILLVLLKTNNDFFGMPNNILACLTGMAACLCIYSTTCYFFVAKNHSPFIVAIGIANLMYCLLTIGWVISHYRQLTFIGITYFSLECIIIMLLACLELQVVNKINKKTAK